MHKILTIYPKHYAQCAVTYQILVIKYYFEDIRYDCLAARTLWRFAII
jgi:hypothetical protein